MKTHVMLAALVLVAAFEPAAAQLTVSGAEEGRAKAVASFKDIKNKTTQDATDFHIHLSTRVYKPESFPKPQGAREISAKCGPFGDSFGFDNDKPSRGQSLITFKKDGERVKAGDKTSCKLSLFGDKNDLKVLDAFWTSDDERIPGDANKVAVPSFEVVGDPIYRIFNFFDTPMGIRNLQFLMNGPELPLGELDPGVLAGFGPFVPDFVLPAGGAREFNIPGELRAGLYLYAQGEVFDADFSEADLSFIHGHQAPVPEPSTIVCLATGLLGLLGVARRRRTRVGP